jgi:elongation factor G
VGPYLLETGVEARSATDAEKLQAAVAQLAAQMPSVSFSLDRESGQLRLKASHEDELENAVTLLSRAVDVQVGSPQVGYREAPTRAAEIDHTYKKQLGQNGQFARVRLRIEPAEEIEPSFASVVANGTIPDEFNPGIERGVRSVVSSGPLIGYPMIRTRVTLLDGAWHATDSSALAFEIATRVAMRESAEKAAVRLFEPFVRLEILHHEEVLGTVIGDLNSRRGEIEAQEMRGEAIHLQALAPVVNLFGYGKALVATTGGRATLSSMMFDHYRAVPNQPPDDVFPPAVGMRA